MSKVWIHWYRNDLRMHDHPVYEKVQPHDHFLPLFILNPEWFNISKWGFPSMGAHRFQFLKESLDDLNASLEKKGAGLIVKFGDPKAIFESIKEKFPTATFSYQKEHTAYELQEEKHVEAIFEEKTWSFDGLTLFHPKDIPFEIEEIPDVFTGFRKKCEKKSQVKPLFKDVDQLPGLPEGIKSDQCPSFQDLKLEEPQPPVYSAIPFKGGETAALERLQYYIWEKELILKYKYTRNQLLGADYSSKLSLWLANGNLSPRYIYHQVKKFEKEVKSNVSTYWLIFELIWRDYFRFIAIKYGNKIFHKGGIQDQDVNWESDPKNLERWKNGKTKEPFVDANMRELSATGFMSNRGRQNVASYLVNELDTDWRWGARWFQSQLIDYDVCSNWGNWMYNSKVGNDPRNRKFNVRAQADRYDPDGKYVDQWL